MAARLRPRDPDIQANLEFARDSISSSISVPPGKLDRAFSFFSLNELTVAVAVMFWIWLILLIVRKVIPATRQPLRKSAVTSGALFFLLSAWLSAAWAEAHSPVAIVVREEAIVRLGPLDESQTAFTAPDGSELEVIDQREGWVQVSDRQNRSGWVRSSSVFLYPPDRSLQQ
jgi:hypothetical protein